MKIMYLIAGFIILLGCVSLYNWFPRIGWNTTTATYVSGGEVQYYVGSEIVQGKLSGGGDHSQGAVNDKDESIRVQYNPDEPHLVRAAPSIKQFIMTILLFGAGFGLMFYVKRQ